MLLVLLPKYTLNPSTSSRFCHQLNMMEKCLSCYSLRTKVLWIILMPEVCCFIFFIFSWLLSSCSFVPDSLWPHGLQYARLPGPSPSPGVCANSCPLNLWCYPAISSSVIPFSSCLQPFPGSGSFPMSQLFPMRWPRYWSFSFSISPSSEYSGLISFRIDWFDLLADQGTLKILL